MNQQYTAEWIHDVILAAAKDSKQNPTIVVRVWGLDPDGFKKLCVPAYENLYTELKHNVEMVVSPVPDPRHAQWKNVAKKHIVNLHEVADLKPFRWGSPMFIQEMASEWKKAGLDGAECYGMISWRWPYSLDKLEPRQTSFWPQGKKLLSFQRDAVWFEALGRYLWKVDRPRQEEAAYWAGRFAQQFGNETAGRQLLQWYDTTGPILPGLQNLTHVHNMNFFPTAVGKEQMVDAILNTAACTRDYPAQPVDTFFFDRYKQKYGMPELTNRITMPIDAYADKLAAGQTVTAAMTPDKVVDLLVEMAEEGCRLAESARQSRLCQSRRGGTLRDRQPGAGLRRPGVARKGVRGNRQAMLPRHQRPEVCAGLARSPAAIDRNLRETGCPDRSDVRQRHRHGDVAQLA